MPHCGRVGLTISDEPGVHPRRMRLAVESPLSSWTHQGSAIWCFTIIFAYLAPIGWIKDSPTLVTHPNLTTSRCLITLRTSDYLALHGYTCSTSHVPLTWLFSPWFSSIMNPGSHNQNSELLTSLISHSWPCYTNIIHLFSIQTCVQTPHTESTHHGQPKHALKLQEGERKRVTLGSTTFGWWGWLHVNARPNWYFRGRLSLWERLFGF